MTDAWAGNVPTARNQRPRDERGRYLPRRVTITDSLLANGFGTLDQPPTFAATLRDLVARQMGRR